jgi:hypothetical protein
MLAGVTRALGAMVRQADFRQHTIAAIVKFFPDPPIKIPCAEHLVFIKLSDFQAYPRLCAELDTNTSLQNSLIPGNSWLRRVRR